jgi:hypothetical protein
LILVTVGLDVHEREVVGVRVREDLEDFGHDHPIDPVGGRPVDRIDLRTR